MNRREFLVNTAAVAAAPFAFGAPGDSGPIKLAVATYSLRSFKRAEAIKMINELGIKFADVKDFHIPMYEIGADGKPVKGADGKPVRRTADQIKADAAEFKAAGIKIIGGGNVDMNKPDSATPAGLRASFEYAKAAGFPVIVCAPTHDNLGEIEKLVKEFNIKIAIHNHGPEDKHFPSPQSVLDAVKNMDHRMGLCIDIGHTSRAGADIVQSIADAGPRLFEIHTKDLKDKGAKDSQVAVGEGVLPIPDIFRQLIKQKYTGYCSLEYEINAKDPLPGMKVSFAYMRKVISEIKA